MATARRSFDVEVARLKAQEIKQDIEDAKFVTGMVTNILANFGGDAAKVGVALDKVANAVFKVLLTQTLTKGLQAFACPLSILSGLSDLFSLFGGGPDVNQLILEQVQEMRRELAEFRQETALNFSHLRKDLFDLTDKVLDRIGAAENALGRQIAEVSDTVIQIQERQRGHRTANH